jgi:cytosolic carboxypeptidase protein 2/3
VSSYVLRGAVEYLVSNRAESNFLKDHFDIYIIPMLNVDGVVSGNYRTSMAGCDLNR